MYETVVINTMLRGKKSSMITILFTTFWPNTIYGLAALFLPKFMEDKDVEQIWTGVILSSYAVSKVGFAFLCGKVIDKISHKKVMAISSIVMIQATVAFGCLDHLTSRRWIVTLGLALRCLQGAAAGYANTAAYSYVAQAYGNDVEKMVAVIEVVAGVGILVGPLLGSVLNQLLGFSWTFWVFGLWMVPSVFAIPHIVPPLELADRPLREALISSTVDKNENGDDFDKFILPDKEDDAEVELRETTTYGELLIIPRVLFAATAVMLGFLTYDVLQPTLMLRMEDYGLDQTQMGMIFSSLPFSYMVGTLCASFVPKWIEIRVTLITGSFLLGASLLLIGPAWGDKSLALMIVGLVLCGFHIGLVTIPNLAEMMFVVKQKYPTRDLEQANSLLSGIMNGFMGIGLAVGPLVGSSLYEFVGFRKMCDFTAGAVMIVTVFYSCFCEACEAFTSTCNNYERARAIRRANDA